MDPAAVSGCMHLSYSSKKELLAEIAGSAPAGAFALLALLALLVRRHHVLRLVRLHLQLLAEATATGIVLAPPALLVRRSHLDQLHRPVERPPLEARNLPLAPVRAPQCGLAGVPQCWPQCGLAGTRGAYCASPHSSLPWEERAWAGIDGASPCSTLPSFGREGGHLQPPTRRNLLLCSDLHQP